MFGPSMCELSKNNSLDLDLDYYIAVARDDYNRDGGGGGGADFADCVHRSSRHSNDTKTS